MEEPDKKPVTMEELLVSSLAHTDALVKLLNELLKRKLANKHFAFVLYTLLAGLSVHALTSADTSPAPLKSSA